jgi:drug/metabolite transporter (DMT)-like permease
VAGRVGTTSSGRRSVGIDADAGGWCLLGDLRGALVAIVSGAITSGLAYSLWYAALPGLATWTAAIVQFAVPVITAVAATWLLGEAPGARLLIAGSLILGGVLLATSRRSRIAPPRHRRTPPR